MFTNTYLPHVGGVARSVATFTEDLRSLGHRVLVIAPTFPGQADTEDERTEVVRVPAIQNFNGSDFSVRVPIPFFINQKIEAFHPDVIHSHHPFLLGDSALRAARPRNLPLVFTHHTLYERYTHYVPLDSPAMKRFVIRLSTEYANLCNRVVAPSRSIAQLIHKRGVRKPIEEIPTGIDTRFFAGGRGKKFRKAQGIADHSLVVGHIGRLAPEKNLTYLAEAVALFLGSHPDGYFLVAGRGPSEAEIRRIFDTRGLSRQLLMAGMVTGQELSDTYKAMDLFVFASKTETQGMVLAEAMAAGKAVIALDASGAREVVRDGQNGRLLPADASCQTFAEAIAEFVHNGEKARKWQKEALKTAEHFSRESCAERMVRLYECISRQAPQQQDSLIPWDTLLRRLKTEWELLSQKTSAAAASVKIDEKTE